MREPVKAEDHIGLVFRATEGLRIPKEIERSDVIGAGMVMLLKAVESYNRRGMTCPFSTYAFRRIRHALWEHVQSCYRDVRVINYRKTQPLETIAYQVKDPSPLPDELADRKMVMAFAAELPPIYAYVIMDTTSTYAELARRTGVSLECVRQRKQRAIEMLQSKMRLQVIRFDLISSTS